MKTKLFTLILSLLLAAMLLSACGGGNTTGNMPENQPEVPSGDNSQNDSASDQPDQPAGDDQPATQPLPPDDGDGEETPSEDPAGGDTAAVSFANDVHPILQSRCINCHGGDRIEGDLVMLSYAELLSGGESGAVIIPGNAAGSLLYQLAESGEMPKRGANLNAAQLELILQWINAGAPDN
jgi:mono/diheme cytochrome c family protein